MAKEKKFVESITDMEVDFPQWYTDVVKKADLTAYSSLKGCMIIRPYGYAIWELLQRQLDDRFKETGVENVYMPMFIPESLLQKEKDHVEGFAPEVAWVTHGGEKKLEDTTWEEYLNMSNAEKDAFFEKFATPAKFFEWREKAEAAYKEGKNVIEVGKDGTVDLGDLVGNN